MELLLALLPSGRADGWLSEPVAHSGSSKDPGRPGRNASSRLDGLPHPPRDPFSTSGQRDDRALAAHNPGWGTHIRKRRGLLIPTRPKSLPTLTLVGQSP